MNTDTHVKLNSICSDVTKMLKKSLWEKWCDLPHGQDKKIEYPTAKFDWHDNINMKHKLIATNYKNNGDN